MGKKYIIEKDDKGSIWNIYADKDGVTTIEGVYLTPYTEPDLEQIRKEAYEAGMNSNAVKMADDKAHEAYQRGLSDAWECAKKIQDTGGNLNWWIHNTSASEAIEKIRQYEQEQEYHVGDEFENGTEKFVVLKMDGKEIDRYIDRYGKTYVMKEKYRVMRKTGRHFPEIVTVLEKMRGEEGGEEE